LELDLVAYTTLFPKSGGPTPAMEGDTGLLFDLPSVCRKKVSAAFDGGRITSDGGVILISQADRRIGIVERIAGLSGGPRDPALVSQRRARRNVALMRVKNT
jgi:hypothetical protein